VKRAHAANKKEIAGLAPSVFEAWSENDRAAQEIIDYAADELILATQVVIKHLKLENRFFDIVLSGGIFEHQPSFVELMLKRLKDIAPRAKASLPKKEPAYGAVLLAIGESS